MTLPTHSPLLPPAEGEARSGGIPLSPDRARFLMWVFEGLIPLLALGVAAALIYWIGAALNSWRMVVTE